MEINRGRKFAKLLLFRSQKMVFYIRGVLDDNKIEAIHRQLQDQMENIVLVGMPGCGKSTVAKRLAKLTGKELVDADAQIVATAGMSIPEIFAAEGESGCSALTSCGMGSFL